MTMPSLMEGLRARLRPGGRARRSAVTALDQAASSLTTLALSTAVAQVSSPRGFGEFALVYTISWLALGGVRALLGETALLIGDAAPDERRGTAAAMGWWGLALGAAIGAVLVAVVGLGLWPYQRALLLALAVALPGVLWQDAMRYVAFHAERPEPAAVSDLIWLVSFIVLAGGLLLGWLPGWVPERSAPVLLLVWGGGAYLGVIVVTVAGRVPWPRVHGSWRWFAGRAGLSVRILADFLAGSGIGQAATLVLPVVASVEAAGFLRSGAVAIGPLNVLVAAVVVSLAPHLRKAADARRLDTVERSARAVALASVAVGVGVGLLVLLVPTRLGRIVLGDSWSGGGHAVAPILACQLGLQMASLVAVTVLRVLGHAGKAVGIRVVTSLLAGGLLLFGGFLGGAVGAAVGTVLASAVGTAVWWWVARGALVRARVVPSPVSVETAGTGTGDVTVTGDVPDDLGEEGRDRDCRAHVG
jgi:O-antigen/teichoic acid export membrane protein